MYIYGLNSHLKCCFKSILQKKREIFFLRSPSFVCLWFVLSLPLFVCTWSAYRSAPIPRNLFCQDSWFGARNSYPNCHLNIRAFANLPIYRKLIHDNISLVFWKPSIFCLVLFWRRYILYLFINITIIIFVGVILKKIKIIFIHNYLRCCKIPKGYSSYTSIYIVINIYSSDTSILLNLHRLSTIPDELKIGFQRRKC